MCFARYLFVATRNDYYPLMYALIINELFLEVLRAPSMRKVDGAFVSYLYKKKPLIFKVLIFETLRTVVYVV